MGDRQDEDLRVGFASRLKPQFLGSQVTTDAALPSDQRNSGPSRCKHRSGSGHPTKALTSGRNSIKVGKLLPRRRNRAGAGTPQMRYPLQEFFRYVRGMTSSRRLRDEPQRNYRHTDRTPCADRVQVHNEVPSQASIRPSR